MQEVKNDLWCMIFKFNGITTSRESKIGHALKVKRERSKVNSLLGRKRFRDGAVNRAGNI